MQNIDSKSLIGSGTQERGGYADIPGVRTGAVVTDAGTGLRNRYSGPNYQDD
jgi:hypothetical protein